MDEHTLERIRQKMENHEKQHKDNEHLQEQFEDALLKRIRQKAEEQEKIKKRHLEWEDNIQALRETYGLSKEEMATIVKEVEQEEQESSVASAKNEPPPKALPKSKPQHFLERMFSLFFSSKGRIGRKTFILSMLGLSAFEAFFLHPSLRFAPFFFIGCGFYAQIILFIKRFHDLDKSGLFTFLMFLPPINLFVLIYLLCFEGTKGANRFDEEPPEF